MANKTTGWYPPEVQPVRVGVYEVESINAPWFRFWDGYHWHTGRTTPRAANASITLLMVNGHRWRGLAYESDDASKLPKEG